MDTPAAPVLVTVRHELPYAVRLRDSQGGLVQPTRGQDKTALAPFRGPPGVGPRPAEAQPDGAAGRLEIERHALPKRNRIQQLSPNYISRIQSVLFHQQLNSSLRGLMLRAGPGKPADARLAGMDKD